LRGIAISQNFLAENPKPSYSCKGKCGGRARRAARIIARNGERAKERDFCSLVRVTD
jgi:hypothetical protein